jgi:ATP-binding cassette subfamily C (CFTR/MRP) protein 1
MTKIFFLIFYNVFVNFTEFSQPVGHVEVKENWPEKGCIVFQNVSLKYRESLEFSLHNVSFTINDQEKIGVVGRTGAGL